MKYTSLFFLLSLSYCGFGQAWTATLDSLKTSCETLESTYPFDTPTEDYEPVEVIDAENENVQRYLQELAKLDMPVEELQKLPMLEVITDSSEQLYIVQWDAQTGGSFLAYYVTAWVRNGSTFNHYELPLAGETEVLETYVINGQPTFLTSTYVKGCGSCFSGELTLFKFDGTNAITEAQLDIYSRSWRMSFSRIDSYTYQFQCEQWDDGYVHLHNNGELTYTSEEDENYEQHFPLSMEDDYTRIGQGEVTIIDGKRMEIRF